MRTSLVALLIFAVCGCEKSKTTPGSVEAPKKVKQDTAGKAERVTYQHLGFKHSVLSAVGPQVWGHALRAWREGFRQGATQGDPWQQGGVLVVRRGGAIEYGFASATAGDHPPLDLVMKHATRAAS